MIYCSFSVLGLYLGPFMRINSSQHSRKVTYFKRNEVRWSIQGWESIKISSGISPTISEIITHTKYSSKIKGMKDKVDNLKFENLHNIVIMSDFDYYSAYSSNKVDWSQVHFVNGIVC
jgi:hypothetical protein